jgi:hypothetical protein
MFFPPFCPNPDCAFHTQPPDLPWFVHVGFHHTFCFGQVPRFRCSRCGKSFSSQSFSLDYYAKRKIDYPTLENFLVASMSIRSMSRNLGCSCLSVLNRLDRLSRQYLACHASLRPWARHKEDVCIDGFVGFDRSQYFPNNITISITNWSLYVLSFTHSTLRRSGSMRDEQKRRRDELYHDLRFEPRALERSFSELLDELARDRPPCPNRPLVIITDEKIEYRRALFSHRLFRDQDADHRVAHLTVNSRLPRTIHNPLFPSNYLDREIRKDQASQRRESTCFGRNVSNGLSRLSCYFGWHNYGKRFRVKEPVSCNQTHGEEAGIDQDLIEQARQSLFTERAFLSLAKLDGVETRVWKKAFPTPGKSGTDYLPAFALA